MIEWLGHCASGGCTPDGSAAAPDARFASPAWQQWPWPGVVHAYQQSVQWWDDATQLPGLTRHHSEVVRTMARQWLDTLSPSNLPFNPELLQVTRERLGANLIEGAQNAADDWRLQHGLQPLALPEHSYRPGTEVAITPGAVVMRNRLVELIQYAPATITVTARPIGFSGKLDEAVYEWTLPEGAAIEDQKQPAARVFTMGSAGKYLVKLKVRDARGNETELEEPVTLGEAERYVIDLQYSGSNANDREPLDVLLRPYISGGHPRDRILTRQYSVDGKPLESAGFYGRTTLQAGEHEIKLKATSEMGKDVEGKLVLKVAENKLPTCTVRSRETIGSWIVYAGCEDPDGRMKSYQWTVGGEVQAITADRLTISKGKDGVIPTIELVGVDDSGGKSESVSLN